MLSNLRVLVECDCELGEGPLWCDKTLCLYWVDIKKGTLHRYQLATQAHASWHLGKQISSIHRREAGGFVITQQTGFSLFEPDKGQSQAIPSPNEPTHNRYNDAAVDPWGRLWAGTMDDNETLATGKLYRLDATRNYTEQDAGYCITNGPAFSPDKRHLYHTDTLEKVIYRFELDEQGEISHKQPFIHLQDNEGYPDGMTVDADGGVWVCHFGGAKVTRYNPAGERVGDYSMPVSNITSCTFVGENLDYIVFTTARKSLSPEQLTQEPLAGSVFIAKPDVKGRVTPCFAG